MRFRLSLSISLTFAALLALVAPPAHAQQSGFARFWHNMTAHYNGEFNADLKLDETLKQLDKQTVDNYDDILPVFRIGDVTTGPKPSGATYDEVIKKCSNVIQLHPGSKWVMQCYMLIGQAYYYKRDYFESLESFQYVYTRFNKQPVRYDALCWIIRGFSATNQMGAAQGAIDAATQLSFPPDKKELLLKAEAAFYVKQKEYAKAADRLQKLVAITKVKADKLRAIFILAQMDQLAGLGPKAVFNYRQVLKMNPSYEMGFAAKLNLARLYDRNSATGGQIKKDLRALARDDKNIAYRDVLYYELGNIAVKENNTPEALKNYKLSSGYAGKNLKQKGISQLAIADLYFSKLNYRPAQRYYDSAYALLDAKRPDYAQIGAKRTYLTDLVTYLETIHVQDSLQALAAMPENERRRAIDKQIAAEARALEKAREASEQADLIAQQNAKAGSGAAQIADPTQASSWYFYNPAAITAGTSDFIRRWGTRPLEDDWRRSKKDNTNVPATANNDPKAGDPNTTKSDGKGTDGKAGDGKAGDGKAGDGKGNTPRADPNDPRTRYAANIPTTPEQKAVSDDKIMGAYYGLGQVYQEQMHSYADANTNYETLLKLYPSTPKKPGTYYNLYRSYQALGDTNKAQYYKNLLMTGFPETKEALLASGKTPENADLAKIRAAAADYQTAYEAFVAGKHAEALQRATLGDSLHRGSTMRPRFALLKAMATGKVHGPAAYEAELVSVVKTFPKDPVQVAASDMLKALHAAPKNAADSAKAAAVAAGAPKVNYSVDAAEPYYYIAVFEPGVAAVAQVQSRISDFNLKSYSLEKLNTSVMLTNDGLQSMIVVKQFANLTKAHDYFQQILVETPIFRGVTAQQVKQFFISQSNYVLMYQANDTKGYAKFAADEFSMKR